MAFLRSLVRAALVGFATIAAILVFGYIAAMAWSFWDRPTFDVGHPQYKKFVAFFEMTEAVIADGLDQAQLPPLDLASLNGGDWITACVFGGYVNPSEKLGGLGGQVTDQDLARWTKARRSGFRLAEVEEGEIAIAFVDRAKLAHFIHFARGIGPAGQHLERCVSQPETKIVLFDVAGQ